MLFAGLSALLLYALVTFGAVQASSWLLICLGLGAITATYFMIAALRYDSWSLELVLLLIAAVIAILLHSRLITSVVIGLYAWIAARRPQPTLRFLKLLVAIGVAEAVLGLTQAFVSPGWIFGYV